MAVQAGASIKVSAKCEDCIIFSCHHLVPPAGALVEEAKSALSTLLVLNHLHPPHSITVHICEF